MLESLAGRAADFDPMTGVQDLYAILRLGPTYDAAGDRAAAVSAYQRIVDMWADGDARGQEIVRAYQARIDELTRGGN